MFNSALQQAEFLDKYLAEHKKVLGPLHGLPVSVKDQFHVSDGETTMAYVGWIGTFEGQKGTGKEGKFESEIVRELKAQGAIPIVKVGGLLTNLVHKKLIIAPDKPSPDPWSK